MAQVKPQPKLGDANKPGPHTFVAKNGRYVPVAPPTKKTTK